MSHMRCVRLAVFGSIGIHHWDGLGEGKPSQSELGDNSGVDACYLAAIINFWTELHSFSVVVIDQPIEADGFQGFMRETG